MKTVGFPLQRCFSGGINRLPIHIAIRTAAPWIGIHEGIIMVGLFTLIFKLTLNDHSIAMGAIAGIKFVVHAGANRTPSIVVLVANSLGNLTEFAAGTLAAQGCAVVREQYEIATAEGMIGRSDRSFQVRHGFDLAVPNGEPRAEWRCVIIAI